MSIEWSTAPEGATHWEPNGKIFREGWMKKEGNKWSYWVEGRKVWISQTPACSVSAEREATFEARPQDTEQIAAEEREAGISDMQTITDGAGPTVYAKLSALYDAGYRRQEEGK
ncbi:TPA: hypothetical protein NIJ97_002018 [Pseudomonas aeruginosa]|nr:hypothetical protein [Pseudomonas aeruginosa]